MKRRLVKREPRTYRGLVLFWAAALGGAPPSGAAWGRSVIADVPGATLSPPPVPKGYKNTLAVLAALQQNRIKAVDLRIAPGEGITVEKGLAYGHAGDRRLKLDLYRPDKHAQPVPGIIIIHGGGWGGGTREIMHFYCVKLTQRGYVTATISYRLAGEAPYPAAVEDAKCAVRWMRANAKKYNVDPNKIGVLGGSAGGHLAMMVAYASDVPELEGNGGHTGVSSRVQALINFYGPTDLTSDFARENPVVVNFMGNKSYKEVPEQYRQASPVHHLTKDDPPTLILHGTIDDIVPIDQADRLAQALAKLKIPCMYERFEGWPHAMDVAADVNLRCLWAIDQFLGKHLPVPGHLTAKE